MFGTEGKERKTESTDGGTDCSGGESLRSGQGDRRRGRELPAADPQEEERSGFCWKWFGRKKLRRPRAPDMNHGEFDPGSERTLAARLKHASRTARQRLAAVLEWRTGEERVGDAPSGRG